MKALFNLEKYINDIQKTTTVQSGLDIIADIIIKKLNFSNLVILIDNRMNIEEGGKPLVLHYGFNANENDLSAAKDNFYLGILEQKLFKYKQSLVITDIKDKKPYFHSIANKYLKSLIIVPIFTKNRNIGMIYTGNNSILNYSQELVDNLELLAKIYSMNLEIIFSNNEAKLFLEKGQELFEIDNKVTLIKVFYQLLEKLFPRKTRHLLMFDGENFGGGSNILNKVLNNNNLGRSVFLDDWFISYFQRNEYYIWNGKRTNKTSFEEENLFKYFDFPTIRDYFRNALIIPMKFSNRILGYLFLFDYRGRVYYENHVKSLLPFIRQLTSSFLKIENNELILKKNEDIKHFAIRTVHGIRNPAESINTLLKSYIRDNKLSQEQENDMEVLDSSIKRIQEIATDYLRLTLPIEFRFSLMSIDSLVNAINDIQRNSNFNCNIKVKVAKKGFSIYIDISEILSVFEELIYNSEKNNATEIIIDISSNNDRVFFYVIDNGIGISTSIIDTLFEPAVSINYEGGLGLSIVKKIINEHKGDIFIDKNYLEGAKFMLWLPIIN